MFPLLIASALELAAQRDEAAVALRAGHRTITYGELDAYSSALAVALERRGVSAGDRVATLLDGVEAVVAFWAIAKASAVGVALDDEDLDELAESLREVDARALIVDAEIAPSFPHAVARAPSLRAAIVHGHRGPVEAAGSAAYVSYDTALAEEDPFSRPALPGPGARRIDLDDAWLERDDEGERVALSHRVLLARAASLASGIDLAAEDVVAGGPFAEIAIAAALAGAALRAGEDEIEGTARLLFVGESDDEAEPGETLVRIHRSTQCGPIAVLSEGNAPARVLPNVDVRIVDDAGAAVAAKVVGEITVRSSSVATAIEGAYLRTGDSGMLDDAGALYVL